MPELPRGLYETIRTERLDQQLAVLAGSRAVLESADAAEVPDVVARHIAAVVRRHLADIDDADERVRRTNDLLALLGAHDQQLPGDAVEQLLAIAATNVPA